MLSIQYSRLLEEIDDTEHTLQVIKGKKIQIGVGKKIKLNQDYINTVKNVIEEIKNSFSSSKYTIVEDGKLEEKIKLLSLSKDYEMIKYNIAIRTVLDNIVDYHNTDDYLEIISEALFYDKKVIFNIKKKLYDFYGILINKKFEIPDPSHQALQPTSIQGLIPAVYPMLPKLKKATKIVIGGIKKHPKIAIALAATSAIMAIGTGTFKEVRKRITQTSKFKDVAVDDLEYVLLVTGLCISIAPNYMGEVEYHKYFKSKMKYINAIKKRINNELYVKWYEKEKNSEMMILLNRFDEYLIKYTDFIKR